MVVVAGLACAGCAPTMQEIAASDDAVCKSYGLLFGTPEYAQCRMTKDQGREAAWSANQATLLGGIASQGFQRPYVLPMPQHY
jgi:hypothetical protein